MFNMRRRTHETIYNRWSRLWGNSTFWQFHDREPCIARRHAGKSHFAIYKKVKYVSDFHGEVINVSIAPPPNILFFRENTEM